MLPLVDPVEARRERETFLMKKDQIVVMCLRILRNPKIFQTFLNLKNHIHIGKLKDIPLVAVIVGRVDGERIPEPVLMVENREDRVMRNEEEIHIEEPEVLQDLDDDDDNDDFVIPINEIDQMVGEGEVQQL